MNDSAVLPQLDTWEVDFDATRTVFGAGSLARVGELAVGIGARRPLLVTDPGLRAVGHAERARAALAAAGLEVTLFDGVPTEPTTAHVDAGVEVARAAGVDAVVALGGGSAMDCAKGINFLFTHGGRLEELWGRDQARVPLLPAIGVPTTAGTGSEAQSFALIAQADSHVKMACGDRRAKFAAVVLDPELVATQPREVAATSGMDAITHAVESFVTRTRNPFSRLLARAAWRLLEASYAELVRSSPGAPLEPCGRVLLGAHLAGAAIEHSMLGAAHACANPLSARYGTTHGVAVGVMLPHVVRFNAETVDALYAELDASGGGAAVAARVSELLAEAGLPGRLRELDVERAALPGLAAAAAEQWTARHNPRPVGAQELERLYEAAW